MRFDTAFSLGDEVHIIGAQSAKRLIRCITCQHTGKVTIGGETFTCPKCNGESRHPVAVHGLWFIVAAGRVGKVSVEVTGTGYYQSDRGDDLRADGTVAEYMIDSTGVGGGSVWHEWRCFPNREAAQAECDRRNALVISEDEAA